MKLGMRKKNASALTAILFVATMSMLSQSMGMDLPGNHVDNLCSVITASYGDTVLFGGNVDLKPQVSLTKSSTYISSPLLERDMDL